MSFVEGKPAAKTTVFTHCPYCSLQCGMTLTTDENAIPQVSSRDFPTNKGGLCRKGWTCAGLLEAPDRLTKPLLRESRTSPLQPVTWQRAVEHIGVSLQSIRQQQGNDAVAVFGGGALTNEKAYSLGKFARAVLGTRHIDYNGRFCMAAGALASQLAFGIDRGLPFPLEDIPLASLVIIAGSNPATTMPPVMQYFDEQQQRGGRRIVIDPRKTATAADADLHLQPAPGSDGSLYNGLLHILIRDQRIDPEFIAEHTNDYLQVKHCVQSYWPDRVERETGVSTAALERAAKWLGDAKSVIALSGRGIEQQVNGVDNDLALINVILALGMVGKPGCGYGCLTGQGNGQGSREQGMKCDQLPGYRRLDDPPAREWVASHWGIPADSLPPPGVSACELFERMGEDIHALLVFAANPAVSAPDSTGFRNQLERLDLLVVCDTFMSETAALADVVLPVTQWAEESGTTTNVEGRVLLRQPSQAAPEGVLGDIEVMAAIAAQLGFARDFTTEPEAVFDELRQVSKGGVADYNGMNYHRIIAQDGVFWPCPDSNHPGTPRLFKDGFPTADGRARFHPVTFDKGREKPDQEYPFFITTGRLLLHYQTGVQTRRIAALSQSEPAPLVDIHPSMAQTYGIKDAEPVRVTTRHGSIELCARLTEEIRLDTLFVPFHWGGATCANVLTGATLDPKSKIPAFKNCVGRIEPLAMTGVTAESLA